MVSKPTKEKTLAYSRLSEQELLIADGILIPPTEENRLKTINNTFLLSEDVDCMGPEFSDELNDRMSTPYNPTMRTIVDGELKCSRGLVVARTRFRSDLMQG